MSDLRLAARTARIAPFQVMELVKRAVALEHAGRPVIHLSIGEPDFTAPEPVVAALERAVRAGHTQYTSALGLHALREAIARDYLERHGVHVDPARIVVTAGASAALSLACCALVDVGDEVLVTDPSYPCNRHFVAAFDGAPKPVPVFADTRFQMTEGLLDAHWGARTRGALLASPANPTGTSIPFDELGRIVANVRARGGFTIVDEIYLGLSYEGRPRTALELGDDVVVVNSFSKYFHMTGWRLGWLVVPPSTAAAFEKLSQNLYICASTLAQHAAIACFTPEALAIYEARRDAFRARRDYIVPAMRGVGFDVPVMPDGAFYAWLDCARFGDSGALASRLLEEASVSLVPGHDFGANDPGRWMRLSYATAREKLEEAVARIGRCVG
ncbi:MAG: pyridoxal phosphate-dependent aminotransferase [Burkholderiaceae bacterium]|jgi:aspartate/methionine/tyrosine aminotransferase|nr:pyridoxal phosphate-dependent aminotransferase [Burkholderiales bacterium]MCZ8337766.1 pyridoxal phosphate-dependent aminotransferase [Burkholderiaceae bacterium]